MAYSDDVISSHTQMQSDKKATPTQAGHAAADIAHHLRMYQATKNWPGNQNEGLVTLRALGIWVS
jgi:hypothetical protein